MSNFENEPQPLSFFLPEEVWPFLADLAGKEEWERRQLLRPHAEAGFGPEERAGIGQRRRLDVALGALTRLEIAHQLEIPAATISEAKGEILSKLFRSEAFLRYVNVYLYFGVRFLAGRVAPPLWLTEPVSSICGQQLTRDSNERPFALKTPPSIDYSAFSDPTADEGAAAKQRLQVTFYNFIESVQRVDPARNPRDTSPVIQALDFLDGSPGVLAEESAARSEDPRSHTQEAAHLELWLRGLRPEVTPTEGQRFTNLALGLFQWAITRSEFYLSLPPVRTARGEASAHDDPFDGEHSKRNRPLGGWSVSNPAAARLALADMYWISRLLRAEVSADASVRYTGPNWLHLLRRHAALLSESSGRSLRVGELREVEEALWRAEEVLRSVFDFVCDLVQNALAVTKKREHLAYEPERPKKYLSSAVGWRCVFDEELEEIETERCQREFTRPPHGRSASGISNGDGRNGLDKDGDSWSKRIRTGEQPRNLIGLAFSGGGIRSATFNLGVLQGLQEFDVLRSIDFLSSVSGGGFIGAWLVANVCRTSHWLGSHMNWEESITHLRRYSNYLSPRTGVLSTDTWTMWASWARNAFLIQLTGLAWLFALLSSALMLQSLFHGAGGWDAVLLGMPVIGLIATCSTGLLLFTLVYNLWDDRALTGKAGGGKAFRTKWVEFLAVLPAWIAAFLLASLLWADATERSPLGKSKAFENTHFYSQILTKGISLFPWQILFGTVFVALTIIAFFTLSRFRQAKGISVTRQPKKPVWRLWHSAWIGLLCVLVFYLEICAILWLFIKWSADQSRYDWYAFVLGPPLVLAACTISVIVFIGLTGRNSNESIREWWTRFGTWLGVYGFGYLLLTGFAVFGPSWTLRLLHTPTTHPALISGIKWASVVSWIGTVLGGLLAGKSSKTSGAGVRSKSPALEILANLGGLLFIVGAILVSATVLYVLLFNVATTLDLHQLWDYWPSLHAIRLSYMFAAFVIVFLCGSLFSRYFEINIFGLNQFYRNRLVRCYLGATRWAPGFRQPQPFTKFDGKDDMKLSAVLERQEDARVTSPNPAAICTEFRGPFPILNCALNLAGSSDLDLHTRHSASFSLTPKRCGADREKVGYAPTQDFANGVMLGQAVAISGAAASPNMGYNTSPLVAFLLTMFNVRLGWWFPNPSQRKWRQPGLNFSLWYLVKELFGVADESSEYINVSDGGHFENLGIYELVRRRCKVIIASDAECDEALQFGSLGNVVRLCETDFGAKIDINVSSIRLQKNDFSLTHCTVGRVTYSNGSIGYLIYLKASMTGDEEVGVTQYRSIHPSFPHESTADQFFSEDQFESYRQLGRHVVRHSMRTNQIGDHPVQIAEKLADVLAPTGCSSDAFLKHTKTLDEIWERFRGNEKLRALMNELEGAAPAPDPRADSDEETIMGLEIIQLMENVFLDLRLDDFWEHPDNRGWAVLFMRWAGSPKLRDIWVKGRSTFGIRFEYFCEARLGLPRDNPMVRV
jgi:hypothetical protein